MTPEEFEPELSLDLFNDLCECDGNCICSDDDFDEDLLDDIDDLEDTYEEEEE